MSQRVTVAALARFVVAAAIGVTALQAVPAFAAGTSSISGAVYDDANRNGVRDAGESPFANQLLLLFNASGTNVGSVQTDANGVYAFSGLADGTYTVKFSSQAWFALRSDWVPTTTGSLFYTRTVSLAGTANSDFGLRRIVRSTSLDAPQSSYAASNGLVVKSYDDVVRAQDIYNALRAGTLIGAEAATTTVYFDYGTQTDATTSATGQNGSYSGFQATLWIAYLSWLDADHQDQILFHEYGHGWANYNSKIVQQDDTLSSYLQARGIAGDSRLYSSKAWDPNEMIAEDYRQLFGSATAASYPQMNTAVPAAAQVAGLKDFLQNTFTQPPASSGGTSGGTSSGGTTTTQPTVTISGLAISPQPVSKSGTVTFTVSQHAKVTVSVLDSSGALVRRLLTDASASAGVSTVWDRTTSAGRRAKAGSYTVAVSATDDYAHVVTASTPFQVV
jgi:hypothetical protein